MARKAKPKLKEPVLARPTARIRMYNVGFGDCFLLRLPGADGVERKVLIDCGKHKLSHTGPKLERVVKQVLDDLQEGEADGPRVDVLVVTHRHQDHVSGFALPGWENVTVGEVWMPWTEDPDDSDARAICEAQSRRSHKLSEVIPRLKMDAAARDDLLSFAGNNMTNEKAMALLHGGFRGAPRRRFLPTPDGGLPQGHGRRPQAHDRLLSTDHLAGIETYVLGPSRDVTVIRDMEPPKGKGYELGIGDSNAVTPLPPFQSRWSLSAEEYSAWYTNRGLEDPLKAFDKPHPVFELRLMPGLSHKDQIARKGRNLVVIAEVESVLHFRIFNRGGRNVVDIDESSVPRSKADELARLKKKLQRRWPPNRISKARASRAITAVASIAGYKLPLSGPTTWAEWAEHIGRFLDEPEMELAAALESSVNGTSLVLIFKVGQAVLLFPGDAQWGTWNAILRDDRWNTLLKGVSFFKVGHHGSGNATPLQFVESFLPSSARAMIPTDTVSIWPTIPKPSLMAGLKKKRVQFVRSDLSVRTDPPEFRRHAPGGVTLYVDAEFPC